MRSLFIVALVLSGCSIPNPPPPPVADAPAPPPLPCVIEKCAPRPEKLTCIRWELYTGPSGGRACGDWQILWEDHCQCLERKAHPPDGGAEPRKEASK